MKIALAHFRVGETDGVALEMEKLASGVIEIIALSPKLAEIAMGVA